jgi:hypothetical protein
MSARGAICVVASIGILGCAAPVESPSSVPGDVAKFVERREICDHFRGEEPYSPGRRAELEQATEKYCRGTDRELISLQSKYRGNAAILKVLAEYEQDIEWK